MAYKRIDLSNLGGFPMTQFTLSEMQDNVNSSLGAIAKMIGDKVILTGLEITGSDVSDGFISYGDELIPFIGGPLDSKVAISEVIAQRAFEDTNVHDAYFTRTASCAPVGDFDFADLIRLETLVNHWQPNDLKQKYVTNDYITANFDDDGYGLNNEKGWRILSKVIPDAAGKMFVNLNPADAAFDEAGKTGGSKTKTLSQNEQGSLDIKGRVDDITGPGSETAIAGLTINGVTLQKNGGANQGSDGGTSNVKLKADAIAFSLMNPYFVVLTLIKL